jgi:serine phosphatase RsbU (regulator of sigma subunit)
MFNIDGIEDKAKKNYLSLLPDETMLRKYLPDAFVINKPMSNVGGDGYWMFPNYNIVFLAVFDCMGQGHLASMMTRIYANALKKLVMEYKIEFPGSTLQYIHREIQSRFKDKEHMQLSTGADLAFLKIDFNDRKMAFAGAKMDLLEVSKGNVKVIKGDEHQVGMEFDHKREYNSHILDMEEGAKYYLFTDGIKELVGGPEHQKLGVDQLAKLVKKYFKMPISEQKEQIQRYLSTWQGLHQQYDDMLMLGFSV